MSLYPFLHLCLRSKVFCDQSPVSVPLRKLELPLLNLAGWPRKLEADIPEDFVIQSDGLIGRWSFRSRSPMWWRVPRGIPFWSAKALVYGAAGDAERFFTTQCLTYDIALRDYKGAGPLKRASPNHPARDYLRTAARLCRFGAPALR